MQRMTMLERDCAFRHCRATLAEAISVAAELRAMDGLKRAVWLLRPCGREIPADRFIVGVYSKRGREQMESIGGTLRHVDSAGCVPGRPGAAVLA